MSTSTRWTTVRDELRQRREARAADRALRADLAHYRTPTEIDDLLATVAEDDSREAEIVRDVLMDNLAAYRTRRAG
jgi:hypothetical protein